ncbi:Ubiquitin--protein ligase [Bertholletia excelsa]
MMVRCHRNDVGSVVLDRGGGSSRLWMAFSGAAFRRKIIDTMRCGGSLHRHERDSEAKSAPEKRRSEKPRVECGSDPRKNAGSEKLSELLRLSESSETGLDSETAEEVKRKVEALEEMKRVVRKLQCDDVLGGAVDVRRLTKENSEARTTLALLGAIPPLVALLDSEDVDSQIASLYALLNLGIGNDANKGAIVKAGAAHKMLKLIDSPNGPLNPAVSEAIIANFLGLSALDSNKPIIGSSGAIPYLVRTLQDPDRTSSFQAKQDSLRALYNLSIAPSNVPLILETNLIPFLLNSLGDMEVSERVLSILSNLVSTPEGRKAISNSSEAFSILIDVLNWTDSPGCQEKASYILMVMAHKSYGDRQSMIEAGIASSLLELTLLGSTLAQKRASRILECLRVDKGKQVLESYGGGSAAVSAPICGSSSSSADPNLHLKEGLEEEDMMSEEKKAVKQLVQQSLQNNMKRIVNRANLPHEFVPSEHLKSLTSISTSKSLPF